LAVAAGGRGRVEARLAVETLRRRARLLGREDRTLLLMYLERGVSFRELARLSGRSEHAVARRVRKLAGLLAEGVYVRCLRQRERLSWLELSVARDYWVLGLSMRRIAARRRMTYHGVRKALLRARAVAESTPAQR